MKKIAISIFGLLALLFEATASAAVVWDEYYDGDLSILGDDVGSLQVGTNTILGRGSIFRFDGNAPVVDTDSGFFTLDKGLRLNSVTAVITFLYESDGSMLFDLFTGLRSPTKELLYDVEMVSDTTFLSLLPVDTQGVYRFYTGGVAASIADNADMRWGWKLDMEVSAVPIPGAVWLFGTALIGLAGFGKRRRAAW